MPVTLNLVKEAPDLIAATKQTSPKPPALIILDTLNRSLAGSKSNDADMAAYIRAADTLREAFGCAVVIVHHCGHAGDRPRGHTSLIGAADAVIAVKKEVGTSIFFATVEMMKDGEAGAAFASQLESVEVGHDEDGTCHHVLHRQTDRANPHPSKSKKRPSWRPEPRSPLMR